MTTCTVLILTYKGKHHLEHLLPTVKSAISNTPTYNIDVLIVDNGKDEPTKEYVIASYPEYKFVFSEVNDYLFSLNPYVANLKSEFVLILNDDMRVDANIFNTGLPALVNDPKLFSVNSRLLNWDGNGFQNHVRLMAVSKGWVSSYWADGDLTQCKYTLFGGGGSAFFRVSYYNQLGGFDPYYRPAYCEDLDLSHRAWQRGWPSVIEPKALLYHRDGATIKEQYAQQSDLLTQKIYTNQVKWMLKCVNHPTFKLWFYLLLPKRLLFGWITDKNSWVALVKGVYYYLSNKPKSTLTEGGFGDKELIENYIGQLYKN